MLAMVAASAACGLDAVGERGTSAIDQTDPGATAGRDPSDPSSGRDGAPPTNDATAPTEAGNDDAGTDADASPPSPYSTRLTSGLVALYEFEEGTGVTVHDGTPDPVDLTIADSSLVEWNAHALNIKDFTKIVSTSKFEKAVTRCQATKELTVEAWVHPAMASQDDYGRLVTMADNDVNRNFALGSFKDKNFWASIHGGEDLKPKFTVQDKLAHVVSTRTSDGTLRLYVDGTMIGSLANTASFDDWKPYSLVVGNVATGGKGWRGEIHLLAIYDHALKDTEIAQNLAAGADP
ncbi:hypothetical protein AKJ09_07327 [Labilithrix luteola]|uniref:LamG-like jellyroll fold domain-containing protein n=1 Tax=Labilithrix luteola TaxID=1391654 RepID=A0A0K1Q4J3_9BACT|nr:hypothetical protein AKJ09_07327 [Labilithrix luteola]